MSQPTTPDYSSSYEKYAFADPSLTETSYDSIKSLKERILKDGIDLKIDSHKGFLRCEEPDCKFALKIRYGSSKGSVILGKSRYGHNHDPFKPKSFKKRRAEVLERYYDPEVARDIKLKKLLEDIEKELGVPLTGDDLKKFKNKIYNIRQKIRRQEEKKAAAADDSVNTGAHVPLFVSQVPAIEMPPVNPIPLPKQKDQPPLKKFKRTPIVKRINADEIKKIIDESKIINPNNSNYDQIRLPQRPGQPPLPQLKPLPPLHFPVKERVQVVVHNNEENNNVFAQEELNEKKQSETIIKDEKKNHETEINIENSIDNKTKDRESPNRFSLLLKRIF